MHGLAEAQHKYDKELPNETAAYFRRDELEFNPEVHRPRFATSSITDSQVEKFIADLVAAPNKDIFLENTIGALPRSASNEFQLQIAVANQWVKDPESVGSIIGPVFWRWAKNAAIAAQP